MHQLSSRFGLTKEGSACPAAGGFSLLELLVVVSIIATLGGVVVLSLDGTKEGADQSIAQAEMATAKAALLRFRDDMGYLPGQGPLGLATGGSGSLGQVDLGGVRRQLGDFALSLSDGEVAAIFGSPACFLQLFKEPLGPVDPATGIAVPVVAHDPIARRGWRGPYLHGSEEGYVAMAEFKSLDTWDPEAGLPISAWIPTLIDPFLQTLQPGDPHHVVSIGPPSGGRFLTKSGRPYLLFDLGDPERARLVCTGPNGRLRRADGTLEGGTLLYVSEKFEDGDDNVALLLLR